MKIILVEPGKRPEVKEIPSTLQAMQKIVDGNIEAAYPFDDPVALVCNEEGKLRRLPFNRWLERNGNIIDAIVGTMFLCGIGEADFTDIPEELLDKYIEKFWEWGF